MGRVEILGSVERRRRWTAEEKVAILDEAFGDGGSVAAASERHGVSRALIYYWRRQAREGAIPGVGVATPNVGSFVPVRIEAAPQPGPAMPAAQARASPARRRSSVEITLGNGRTVTVDDGIDPATLAGLIAALDGDAS